MAETLTMNPLLGDLLKREYDRIHCRDSGTLKSGNNLKLGAVLGAQAVDTTAGNVTVTATAGNTGDGTLTKAAAPVLPGAQPGIYWVVCHTAAANGGIFAVLDPAGAPIGNATVGTAFAQQIAFTIGDGAVDFIVGDSFAIYVPPGDGKLVPIAVAPAANGSHRFAALLLEDVDASTADVKTAVLARGPAVVVADRLVWPAAFDTAAEKNTVIAQMLAKGIRTLTGA